MTDIEVTLNAWEVNHVPALAVQGEAEGRKIIATLIDRTGQTSYTYNAESEDRAIDLAGATARLYCIKPDKTVTFSDGTVTDATKGIVSFVLPYQATTASGTVPCQILLSWADNSSLKTIGLYLEVQESNLDEAIESTNEYSSLVESLNEISQSAIDAQTAVTNANTAISGANTARDGANTAATSANAAATSANSAATAAKNLPYVGADGYWHTYDTTTAAYKKTTTSANVAFATFDVDPATGILSEATPEGYAGVGFTLNDSGELEATI